MRKSTTKPWRMQWLGAIWKQVPRCFANLIMLPMLSQDEFCQTQLIEIVLAYFFFLVIRSLQSFFSSREDCWKLAPWTYLWRGSDGPWNSPEVYFQLFANDSCPPAKICCFSVSHKKEHHKFWIKTGYWKRWFKLLFQRWYNQSNPGSTWMWTNYGW